MRKFVICLLMMLMIWTIIEKYEHSAFNKQWFTYVLQDNQNNRRMIQGSNQWEFTIGDKVTIEGMSMEMYKKYIKEYKGE